MTIATQTGWKLEPLFRYDDSLSTTPAPQLHTTSTNSEDVAPSQPPSFVPSTPSIPMTSPPLLQQQSQLDGATMHTTQFNINPSNSTMHTVQFHNPGSGSSSNETEAAMTTSSSNTTNTEDWLDNGSVQGVSSDLSNSANSANNATTVGFKVTYSDVQKKTVHFESSDSHTMNWDVSVSNSQDQSASNPLFSIQGSTCHKFFSFP